MNRYAFAFICLTLTILLSNCGNNKSDHEMLAESVDSFAVNYFNWNFAQAARYCTQESQQWMQYAASQVTPADIEMLRNKNSELVTEIADIALNADKTEASVTINVTNYIEMRNWGTAPKEMTDATYKLKAVRINNTWKIRMEALPQSEKQNHD